MYACSKPHSQSVSLFILQVLGDTGASIALFQWLPLPVSPAQQIAAALGLADPPKLGQLKFRYLRLPWMDAWIGVSVCDVALSLASLVNGVSVLDVHCNPKRSVFKCTVFYRWRAYARYSMDDCKYPSNLLYVDHINKAAHVPSSADQIISTRSAASLAHHT